MKSRNIRFGYVILTFVFLFCIGFVHSLQISAQILSHKGIPIEDVCVTDGRARVFTNRQGIFSIDTAADSLVVSKLGFEQQTIYTMNIPAAITLQGKSITLSTVRVIERFDSSFNPALDRTTISTDAENTGKSTSDILLKESIIHSSDSRLTGENQTLSILGNLSRHTLIVLDNVPLNPHGEAFDMSSLPMETIKRIEIVKGNASLYGGASAIGGIVYLFTDNIKVAHPFTFERTTSYGSFNQFRRTFVYEQQTPQLSYKVTHSKLTADNDFLYKTPNWWPATGFLHRENNRKEQQDFTLQVNTVYNNIICKYKLNSDQIYRQLPGPVNFPDVYKNAYLKGQNLRHNLNLDYKYLNLDNNLIVWHNNDNTEYRNTRAINPIYPTHYRQNQFSAGLKNQTGIRFYPVKASLDLELSRQTYERKDILYPSQSISERCRNQGAFAFKVLLESEIDTYTNQVQAGFRLDKVNSFHEFKSWRLEELFKAEGVVSCQIGASLGTGFSLPSFYDLYYKGDAQSLGNPDLKPEASRGGNLWIDMSTASTSFRIGYYKNVVTDLIQWRQVYLYGTAWKPVNIGQASFENWEYMLKTRPYKWLNVTSSLTMTEARDELLDTYLVYTPEFKWLTDITLIGYGCALNLNMDYTGEQYSTPDNYIDPIPYLILYNVSLQYGYSYKKLSSSIYLNLNNLFDRHYEIYAYVPQPGFNWMSGINIKFEM